MSDDPTSHRQRFIEFVEQGIPFNRLLGLRVTELSRGRAVCEVPFRRELIGDIFRPAIHGGVVSTLIDATGGVAGFSMIDVVDRISTVDMRVDYLRPGLEDTVVADAEVVRMGNRVCVVHVVVHQGDRTKPIADGRCVYNVRRNVGSPVDKTSSPADEGGGG